MAPASPAGLPLSGLCVGDSTTNAGHYTAEVLTFNAGSGHANASATLVQNTLIGTRGAGANKHEGFDGRTVKWFFSDAASPFVEDPGDKFSAAYYLANTGQAAPDWVFQHLGINDVFNCTDDSEVHRVMDDYLDMVDRMIGLIPDATVGSWKEARADIVTLLATPIPPGEYGDGWGWVYSVGQDYARYRLNWGIAVDRIIQHYAGTEASKVFLVPWHVSIDPITGFNSGADLIHPIVTGYNQMGDALVAAINVLAAEGVFA